MNIYAIPYAFESVESRIGAVLLHPSAILSAACSEHAPPSRPPKDLLFQDRLLGLYEQLHLYTEKKSRLQGTVFWGPEVALPGK